MRNKKYILSVLFIVFLFVGFFANKTYEVFDDVLDYWLQLLPGSEEKTTFNSIETDYDSNLPVKNYLVDFNGEISKVLNLKTLYSSDGIYITDNNYIITPSDYTSGDYEYEQITDFYNFLNSNDVNFLFVNQPTKYIDDSIFMDSFGVSTYSNQNMDCFLERLSATDIQYIDLRENIKEENIDVFNLFYRTDHHWTTDAGLWASRIIVNKIDEMTDYDVDASILDDDNFIRQHFEKCWLGEQGSKVAATLVGYDDFTYIRPDFDTKYIFFDGSEGEEEGDFGGFVNVDVYLRSEAAYYHESWHYSYRRRNCENKNVEKGKVLLICDSYAHVTEPFMSLCFNRMDTLILRDYGSDFDLRQYILDNEYDTVVVAYAQFMLGAHDDENSANYRMYTFE